MNETLQKLIDDARLKPISECPIIPFEDSKTTRNPTILAYSPSWNRFTTARYEYTDRGKGRFMHQDYHAVLDVKNFTHFIPLPNNRLANALEIAVDGLTSISEQEEVNGFLASEAAEILESVQSKLDGKNDE